MHIEALEPRLCLSTYYVATSGSDSASGTSSAPWRTLQHFIAPARSGDVLIVRAGSYAGVNASQESGLTFKADPGVTINVAGGSGRDGFNFENCSQITVDGFTVQPLSSQSAWRSGIRFGGGGTGNAARGNRVAMRAVDVQGIFSSFNTNQLVEGNEVSGNNDAGIYCSNSAVNPTVRNNYVHDISKSAGLSVGLHFNGDASQGGDGIIHGATVEGNRVSNCNTGISMDGVQDVTVTDNMVSDVNKGINGYKVNAAAGGKNTTIIGNTVVRAAQAGILLRQGATGSIVNNHLIDCTTTAIQIDTTAISVDFNLATTGSRYSTNDGSSTITFTSWRSSGRDAHGAQYANSAIYADANYSAGLTDDDYSILDANYGQIAVGTVFGDLNGDGRVNDSDYGLLDAASLPLLPS